MFHSFNFFTNPVPGSLALHWSKQSILAPSQWDMMFSSVSI